MRSSLSNSVSLQWKRWAWGRGTPHITVSQHSSEQLPSHYSISKTRPIHTKCYQLQLRALSLFTAKPVPSLLLPDVQWWFASCCPDMIVSCFSLHDCNLWICRIPYTIQFSISIKQRNVDKWEHGRNTGQNEFREYSSNMGLIWEAVHTTIWLPFSLSLGYKVYLILTQCASFPQVCISAAQRRLNGWAIHSSRRVLALSKRADRAEIERWNLLAGSQVDTPIYHNPNCHYPLTRHSASIVLLCRLY